jgi:hypothetical protein
MAFSDVVSPSCDQLARDRGLHPPPSLFFHTSATPFRLVLSFSIILFPTAPARRGREMLCATAGGAVSRPLGGTGAAGARDC